MTDTPAPSTGTLHACYAPGATIDTGVATPHDAADDRSAPGGRAASMVRADGGMFLMGTGDPGGHPADGEGPVHRHRPPHER